MITKNPADPKTSSHSGAKPGSTVLNPRDQIEVAAGGNGTVNDPSGSDIKPPFTGGFEIPV
jgi:hypothetical protein